MHDGKLLAHVSCHNSGVSARCEFATHRMQCASLTEARNTESTCAQRVNIPPFMCSTVTFPSDTMSMEDISYIQQVTICVEIIYIPREIHILHFSSGLVSYS